LGKIGISPVVYVFARDYFDVPLEMPEDISPKRSFAGSRQLQISLETRSPFQFLAGIIKNGHSDPLPVSDDYYSFR
jgi:hypothetical protein